MRRFLCGHRRGEVVQRHDDVLDGRGPRQEIEVLKDKTELFRSHEAR